MNKKRLIVYGDIHGCYDEFVELRLLLNITNDDQEVSVGDVLDRGPKSLEALRYIVDNGIMMIRGNHEHKHIRYKIHQDNIDKFHGVNPVQLDDSQRVVYPQLSESDFVFLNSLPYYMKVGEVTIVHGGIPYNVSLSNAKESEISKTLWIRTVDQDNFHPLSIYDSQVNAIKWIDCYSGSEGFVVYGHDPVDNVVQTKNTICIDTGCVYGGKLTAAIFECDENGLPIVDTLITKSIDAKKCYAEKKIIVENCY